MYTCANRSICTISVRMELFTKLDIKLHIELHMASILAWYGKHSDSPDDSYTVIILSCVLLGLLQGGSLICQTHRSCQCRLVEFSVKKSATVCFRGHYSINNVY